MALVTAATLLQASPIFSAEPSKAEMAEAVKGMLAKFKAEQTAEFLKQKNRDFIEVATTNSFLPEEYRPIPGAAVLVAFVVHGWEKQSGAKSGIPGMSGSTLVEVGSDGNALLDTAAFRLPLPGPEGWTNRLTVTAAVDEFGGVWVKMPAAGETLKLTFHISKDQANSMRGDFGSDEVKQVTLVASKDRGPEGGDRLSQRQKAHRHEKRTSLIRTNGSVNDDKGRVLTTTAQLELNENGVRRVKSLGKNAPARVLDEVREPSEEELKRDRFQSHVLPGKGMAIVRYPGQGAGAYFEAYDSETADAGPVLSGVLCSESGTIRPNIVERKGFTKGRSGARFFADETWNKIDPLTKKRTATMSLKRQDDETGKSGAKDKFDAE